jgi:hypothetical protein
MMPMRRVLLLDEVAEHRKGDCANRDFCLSFCAKASGVQSFSCAGCEKYESRPDPIVDPRRSSPLGLVAFSDPGDGAQGHGGQRNRYDPDDDMALRRCARGR